MSYNPSIPQPGDFLSDSQQQILSNFTVANANFGINHVGFSPNSANNGRHTFVEMRNIIGGVGQAVPPLPSSAPSAASLAVGEGTLYTILGTFGSDLYYVSNNNDNRTYKLTTVTNNATRYNFLGNSVSNTVGGVTFTKGWVSLQQGIIMQYGTFTHTNHTTETVPFCFDFTAPPFTVTVTAVEATGVQFAQAVNIKSFNATNFIVNMTPTAGNLSSVNWIAIGPSNG